MIDHRHLARLATTAADHFDVHVVRWAASSNDRSVGYVPNAADVALALNEMISEVAPGERIESGRLVVERTPERDDRPPEIRVFLHLGDLTLPTAMPAGRGDPDAQP